MNLDNRMILIRRNDFLDKLTDEEYESLNIVHNFIIAERSAYIYFDPLSHTKLYFVKEGHVKLANIDDDGNETIKDILLPGDVFGQFALGGGPIKGEVAQAYKSDVSLCAFHVNDFERLLNSKPGLSIEYAKKVGNQMQRLSNRLTNLLQKDVRTRVLYFFWTLVQQHPQQGGSTVCIDNYFTHEDIARLTGTTRQTVTMLINQFTDEGLLLVDRKQILIRDIKLLQKEIKVG